MEWLPLSMFVAVCVVLLTGYPVAFALGGTALLFAAGRSEEHTSELQSPA